MPHCTKCYEEYPKQREVLGYLTCLPCGEYQAIKMRSSWTIAQLYSKGNYQLVTDLSDLTRTNPKRTT
jgi:hypothetical protein